MTVQRRGRGAAQDGLRPPWTKGFSRVELVVTMMTLAFLALIIAVAVANARGKSRRIQCVANLKNLNLGIRVGTPGLSIHPSPQVPISALYQNVFAKIQYPEVLVCPADSRTPSARGAPLSREHISYFLGAIDPTNLPSAWLLGDRNLTASGSPVSPGYLQLANPAKIGWTAALHRHRGNVALQDGSVQEFVTRSVKGYFAVP